MAKGANGTIQINTQTIKQREQFGSSSNSKFGVATDRLSLFPLSPIATNDQPNMYQGEASGAESAIALQTAEGTENIYDVYSNIVDPESDDGIAGFGFDNSSRFGNEHAGKAFLNYRHPNNPFIDLNGVPQSINDGSIYEDTKAYKGHADLAVVDINTPTTGQDESPTSDLELDSGGASYGNTTEDYRSKINNDLGKYDSTVLGDYFRTVHSREEP